MGQSDQRRHNEDNNWGNLDKQEIDKAEVRWKAS